MQLSLTPTQRTSRRRDSLHFMEQRFCKEDALVIIWFADYYFFCQVTNFASEQAREAARNETMAYACYVMLYRRFFTMPASPTVRANIAALMTSLSYEVSLAAPNVIATNANIDNPAGVILCIYLFIYL